MLCKTLSLLAFILLNPQLHSQCNANQPPLDLQIEASSIANAISTLGWPSWNALHNREDLFELCDEPNTCPFILKILSPDTTLIRFKLIRELQKRASDAQLTPPIKYAGRFEIATQTLYFTVTQRFASAYPNCKLSLLKKIAIVRSLAKLDIIHNDLDYGDDNWLCENEQVLVTDFDFAEDIRGYKKNQRLFKIERELFCSFAKPMKPDFMKKLHKQDALMWNLFKNPGLLEFCTSRKLCKKTSTLEEVRRSIPNYACYEDLY